MCEESILVLTSDKDLVNEVNFFGFPASLSLSLSLIESETLEDPNVDEG